MWSVLTPRSKPVLEQDLRVHNPCSTQKSTKKAAAEVKEKPDKQHKVNVISQERLDHAVEPAKKALQYVSRPHSSGWGGQHCIPSSATASTTELPDHGTLRIIFATKIRHRFGTLFDAWAYFDTEGNWEISKIEFRKRAHTLLMAEDGVDVEALARVLDRQDSEPSSLTSQRSMFEILVSCMLNGCLRRLASRVELGCKQWRCYVFFIHMCTAEFQDSAQQGWE